MNGFIEESWKTYRKAVVHPDATPNQLSQLRTAFFGGAGFLLKTVIDAGELEENTGVVLLETLRLEMELFKRNLEEDTENDRRRRRPKPK